MFWRGAAEQIHGTGTATYWLIKVNGEGRATGIHLSVTGSPKENIYSTQRAKVFGEVMIVPAGKYDVYANGSLIEEGFAVEAGKSYNLE